MQKPKTKCVSVHVQFHYSSVAVFNLYLLLQVAVTLRCCNSKEAALAGL